MTHAVQEFLATFGVIVGACFVFLTLFICDYEMQQIKQKRGIHTWRMITGIGGFLVSVIPLTLGGIWFYHYGDAMGVILPFIGGWFIHLIGAIILFHIWKDHTSHHNRPPPRDSRT